MRLMRSRSVAPVIAIAMLCGCSEAVTGQPPPTWELLPMFRIGRLDAPGQSLTTVGAVSEAPHGRLFVLQPQERLIRVFDDSGEFEREIGRSGSGPGEFQQPVFIRANGDSVWVIDRALNRLTVFTASGGYITSFQLPRPDYDRRFPVQAIAYLADGSLLGSVEFSGQDVASGDLRRRMYFRMNMEGEILNTVAELSLKNVLLRLRSSDQSNPVAGLYANQPFSDAPLLSVDPRGERIAVVLRGVSSTGSPPTYSVRIVDTGGKVLAAFEQPFEPIPFPQELRDSVVEAWTASALESRGAGFRTHREARGAVEEELFLPSILPPVTGVRLSDDGSIWVRREERLTDRSIWDVLSPAGRHLGRVVTEHQRLVLIRRDHAWGLTYDDFGVPYLVKLRIRRTADAGGER